MKASKLILLAGLLFASISFAGAEQKDLSEEQKQSILRALKALQLTGVLKATQDGQSVEIDRDVLNELKSEGLITGDVSSMHVICTGM